MNTEESSARGRILWVALLLAGLTFGLYARVRGFDFLNYDDPDYVTRNPAVSQGLTLPGLRWAFGFHAANWHPLTWIAHMLDVELFGLEAGPMHAMNAALHALNAALLLLALAAMTARFWPSLVVAALFAAHPLRVQSVAWIAERKELLASALFFASLLAYARYARTRSRAAYAGLAACLGLGCMAKPMLVTAPFVLLLLDVWPLKRLAAAAPRDAAAAPAPGAGVLLEKLPLFALSAVVCVLTLLAQRAGGAVGELEALSLADRLWTAGAGLLAYLRASVWPAGLAAFYPHPLLIGKGVLVPGLIGIALGAMASLAAWRARGCCPALFTGWFWFLGMLVPVLGLVQVGDQAWADRYAYLPVIGLQLALVFGLSEALRARAALLSGLTLAGLAAAAGLAVISARILPHWQDSRALFERALAVTEGNWVAHNNLGLVYLERRETARAREHFEHASRLRPSFVQAHFNLGLAQEVDGDFPAAVATYRGALEVRPGHPDTLVRLAGLARAEGNSEQAVTFFEQAIQHNPGDAHVWAAFARVLLELGDPDRAANCATSALKLDAAQADAHLILAEIALKRGEIDEAGARLTRAASLAPDSAEVHALSGRWRFQKNDLGGARAELQRAIELDPGAARARHDLGTLLMTLGEFEAARSQFQAVSDIRPGDPQALLGLAALALDHDKKPALAIELLEEALRRLPGFPLALSNMAAAYEQLGQWDKALECYEKSFADAQPDPDAACAAAWILATGPDEALLDGERAVQLATFAFQRQAASALEVLAAAHARNGGFKEAVQVQEEAVQRARNPEQKRLLEQRLELFRAERPYTRTR